MLKYLINEYRVKSKNVLGHSDIAPDRKKDPGEKFPWKKLSNHNLGKWYNEKKINDQLNSLMDALVETKSKALWIYPNTDMGFNLIISKLKNQSFYALNSSNGDNNFNTFNFY